MLFPLNCIQVRMLFLITLLVFNIHMTEESTTCAWYVVTKIAGEDRNETELSLPTFFEFFS